jgi:hypothetical protein
MQKEKQLNKRKTVKEIEKSCQSAISEKKKKKKKKKGSHTGCSRYASRLVQVLFFSLLICSDDVDTGVWARFVVARGSG